VHEHNSILLIASTSRDYAIDAKEIFPEWKSLKFTIIETGCFLPDGADESSNDAHVIVFATNTPCASDHQAVLIGLDDAIESGIRIT
jgi:hypothetical protein